MSDTSGTAYLLEEQKHCGGYNIQPAQSFLPPYSRHKVMHPTTDMNLLVGSWENC